MHIFCSWTITSFLAEKETKKNPLKSTFKMKRIFSDIRNNKIPKPVFQTLQKYSPLSSVQTWQFQCQSIFESEWSPVAVKICWSYDSNTLPTVYPTLFLSSRQRNVCFTYIIQQIPSSVGQVEIQCPSSPTGKIWCLDFENLKSWCSNNLFLLLVANERNNP